MSKISMKTPLVEMDGDEMTRVLWKGIKETLIEPYVELKSEYYDLGLQNRDETEDRVTVDSAHAAVKYGVAVKCATITPNEDRVKEYHLKKKWDSPNATIRSIIGGTVFRAPIVLPCLVPYIPHWKKPITIARHAYGDLYQGVEYRMPGPGTVELVCRPADGGEAVVKEVHRFDGGGVVMATHNTDGSISGFARTVFNYALDTRQDVWFATKDTISQTYDNRFKEIFETIFDNEYRSRFDAIGKEYFYTLIDDAVARVIRSEGGFLWACKNYDGDVMSDMVATVYGSLAMMTSVLVSPAGVYEYEASHGTVTRHYYKHLAGEETSTNPIATLFAWTGALKKRGELDELPELVRFAGLLEQAALQTISEGDMTGDLAGSVVGVTPNILNSFDFLRAIDRRLSALLER